MKREMGSSKVRECGSAGVAQAELRPCPFCGGKAKSTFVCSDRLVVCLGCEASGAMCDTEEKAASMWNLRQEAMPAVATQAKPDDEGDDEQVRIRDVKSGQYLGLNGSRLLFPKEPEVTMDLSLMWTASNYFSAVLDRKTARKVAATYIALTMYYNIELEPIENGGAE